MKLIKAIFTRLFAKKEVASLDSIIENFTTQINNLNERIELDEKSIVAKTEQQKKLEDQKKALTTNVERANRIKAKIEDVIK